MRALLFSIAVVGWLLAGPGGWAAEPAAVSPAVLTNAAQVLQLTAAQAALALPVHLRGVVVDEAEPKEHAIILNDPSASVYLFASRNLFAPFHRRDVLEVTGVTSAGQFAPDVETREVRKVGLQDPPAPKRVTYQQLITGALDAQYVEITGVVRQCWPALTNTSTWRIELAADGGLIPVRVPLPQLPQIQPDAEVKVQAICLYQFNTKRQALSPVLQVPRGLPIGVIKLSPADPYGAPVRSAVSLLQYSPGVPFGHREHVHGVVTGSQPGSFLWIRDASSGLRVQTAQTNNLQPGDDIDVLGFPNYGSSAPVLEGAIYRINRRLNPPVPLRLADPAAAYDHQDDLVSVDALLTDVQPVLGGVLLTFEQRQTVFKAILKQASIPGRLPAWPCGSQVRVTGICDVNDSARPVMGIWHPQSFELLMRSTEDLVVVTPPPWWTPGHLILVLGLFAGLSLTASGIVILLARRRLAQQARRRAMAEAEFAAILSERNRLAREIHDTLAQGLTATAVQLQLVKIHAGGTSDVMNRHLDKAQQMVSDSLEEARNSIWNMRPQVLETGDLVTALKNILKQLSDGLALETRFEVSGRERRLPAIIENNVLRLGQEAITNAIKHAQARLIRVRLDFGEKHFALSVADDGQGFDPGNPPRSAGGFGLVGMRDRAQELKGTLKVVSAPGQGTELSLHLPLAGE